jgi:hypothetical protein
MASNDDLRRPKEEAKGWILLDQWRITMEVLQHCHYELARPRRIYHRWLGAATGVLAGAAGFGNLYTALEPAPQWLSWLLAVLAFAASAIVAVQTSLNFGEEASKHYAAGVRYGAVLRHVDLTKAVPPRELATEMQQIRLEWDAITAEAPQISKDLLNKHWEAIVHGRRNLEALEGTG